MATDFTLALQNGKPIKTIATVSNTNWLLVDIPTSVKRITVGCETQKLFVSFSYADSAVKSAVDTVWIDAGVLYSMTIPNHLNAFQVVADAAPASVVVVVLEEI